MNVNSPDDNEHRFWEHAAPLLDRADVTRSTMMGLPCLRLNGAFFASFDRRTGDLLVKRPESVVDQLVTDGPRPPVRASGTPVPHVGCHDIRRRAPLAGTARRRLRTRRQPTTTGHQTTQPSISVRFLLASTTPPSTVPSSNRPTATDDLVGKPSRISGWRCR